MTHQYQRFDERKHNSRSSNLRYAGRAAVNMRYNGSENGYFLLVLFQQKFIRHLH